jgi:hypothetical protein
MGVSDLVLSAVISALILGGAGYVLYRSIWKRKGPWARSMPRGRKGR